jgi:hypothetical protein
LQLDADARLAAGVGGVARYLADIAGLENEPTSHLQAAVVAACQEAFEYLSQIHPHLDVTFTSYADRIEVALSHEGEGSPAVGLDRIQYETQGSIAVTRLTKYISQGAPSR